MVKNIEKCRKRHIKIALKDLELEGDFVPDEIIIIADEYAEGKIDGVEMVRKMVKIAMNERKNHEI